MKIKSGDSPHTERIDHDGSKEFRITVPHSFMAKVPDWRYSLLMEFALMWAKEEDFIDVLKDGE